MQNKFDLFRAMEDDALLDTTLVGTDNVEVRCTKFMLAARSPIFKSMFFKGFQEQSIDRIALDYPSVVLKVLVKYCYVDEIDYDLIHMGGANKSLTDYEAVSLVQLKLAASYFELDYVAEHVENKIATSVFRDKEVGSVCAIMSELMNRMSDEGPFWDMLFQLVMRQPKKCLLPSRCPCEPNQGALVCHPRLLSKLLDKVEDTYVVVQSLEKWFEATDMEDESSGCLLDFAKGVDLKKLSPRKLSKIKPSALFSMKSLFEAFVYLGSRSKSLKKRESTEMRTPELYVSGAGISSLDGYYHRVVIVPVSSAGSLTAPGETYQKEGKYGEIACHFRITFAASKNSWIDDDDDFSISSEDDSILHFGRRITWTISMIPKGDEGCSLTMYEASGTFEKKTAREYAIPPFKFWRCVGGTEPAPLVAMMDTTSSIDASQRSKRRKLSKKYFDGLDNGIRRRRRLERRLMQDLPDSISVNEAFGSPEAR